MKYIYQILFTSLLTIFISSYLLLACTPTTKEDANSRLVNKRSVSENTYEKYGEDWNIISPLLEKASQTYHETWNDEECRTLHRGAYLGNGDLGIHLGGTKHLLKYYIGKNGFHAGNDTIGFQEGLCRTPGTYKQHILNLAILQIEKSSGYESNDNYTVTQDIKNSEIRTQCYMGGHNVLTKSYISNDDNMFILELSTDSHQEVSLQAKLYLVGNMAVEKKSGVEEDVVWVTKDPYRKNAPFYVNGAVAMKVIGGESSFKSDNHTYSTVSFKLPSNGEKVYLIVNAEHTKNATSPLREVQQRVKNLSQSNVDEIYSLNKEWWKNFWLHSFVKLDDEDIQNLWYNHLYLIGSAARSGKKDLLGNAPGHWGPWNRDDNMHWFGNISMNYNGQNPYYGTFSSNHVNVVDPYIESVKYYAEGVGRDRVVNRWVSQEIEKLMPENCRGVEFELSFTSHGTSCRMGRRTTDDGAMPTNAIFGILPAVWKWKYTQDKDFLANECYPLMLKVVDFYDDYIGEPVNGKYDVYGSVHEGANWFAPNDMFSLGAVRFLYRETINASIRLNKDIDRRSHWQDILNNMSGFRLQRWGDNTITFRPDGIHDVMDALSFAGGPRNTGLMFTTTFDNIGYSSLPAYKIATCNTLDKGNMLYPQRFSGYQDSNDYGIMFVMAIRAGYPADSVIEAIKLWKPSLNGTVSQNEGGGIETAGIVEAIDNMLLQSHDGVIRLFPNWDFTKNAEFKRLRTVGAFLVDAEYDASKRNIKAIKIFSEKGNTCILQNPFECSYISVKEIGGDKKIPVTQLNDKEFSFNTKPGFSYEISSVKLPSVKKGLPKIVVQPTDTTVKFSESATFTVSASGEGLHYQWQKNGKDIPGAIETDYTVNKVGMTDVGSEYRCVISNSKGEIKSEIGILNPDYKHIHRYRLNKNSNL